MLWLGEKTNTDKSQNLKMRKEYWFYKERTIFV